MRQVVLTVGPQGAGKSAFCNQIVQSHPEVVMVSRDAILVELFGNAYLDSYSGGHYIALEKMWEKIAEHMKRDEITMILDCWNGFARERHEITDKLRSLGVERIGNWYFVTPEADCLGWYMKEVMSETPKKDPKWEKFRQESRRSEFQRCYKLFHSQPINIDQGFDFITKINPLESPPFESLFQLAVSNIIQKVHQLS